MKICFFNCAKVWGGGEKWHMEHASAFLQEGHQVVVVSNRNSELLKRAAARHIRTKSFYNFQPEKPSLNLEIVDIQNSKNLKLIA